MWDYGNTRTPQPEPVIYTQGYPGHGPTKIDLRYKVYSVRITALIWINLYLLLTSDREGTLNFAPTKSCSTDRNQAAARPLLSSLLGKVVRPPMLNKLALFARQPGLLKVVVLLQVKTDEYTMHNFHLVKYCHLTHFGSALGLAGLAVVWQVASQSPYQLHISGTVFKVIACQILVIFLGASSVTATYIYAEFSQSVPKVE